MLRPHVILSGVLLCLVGLIPLLVVPQGIDFTDLGYALAHYEFIFRAPEQMEFYFHPWLSHVLGGIWISLFGDHGLLAMKLGGALIALPILALCYSALRRYFSVNAVLGAFVITELIYFQRWLEPLNYNTLTGLFYCASAVLLFHSLSRDDVRLSSLAGLVVGASVFLRFSNIAGLSLIGVAVYPWARKQLSGSRVLAHFGAFLAGFAAGAAVCLLILKMLGHLPMYLAGLKQLLAPADPSLYGAGSLWDRLKDDHRWTVKHTILISLLAVATVLVAALIGWVGKRRWIVLLVSGATSAVGVVLTLRLMGILYDPTRLFHWIGPLAVGIFVITVIGFRRDPTFHLLALLSMLLLELVPAGSGNGLLNSYFGIWLASGVFWSALLQFKPAQFGLSETWDRGMLSLKFMAAAMVVVISLGSMWRGGYRDSKDRWAKTHQIAHPRLAMNFTTAERASATSDLLHSLSSALQPGDTLLAYPSLCLLHFVTRAPSFLHATWPNALPNHLFAKAFRQAIDREDRLPVIVRAKFDPRQTNWPTEKISRFEGYPHEAANVRAMDAFVESGHFRLDHENEFFELWVPRDKTLRPAQLSWARPASKEGE